MEITRRNFVKGAIAGLAGTAALAVTGCAPKHGRPADDREKSEDLSQRVAETRDCDIVVIGGGMSGLTAAVEALNGGANVILLEAQSKTGGNGAVTSVVMGVGTDMQKALGIDVTPAQIISTEMRTFNYSVDGVLWANLVNNSKQNIEWLIEQGALFNGRVDNYRGVGVVPTGHWWEGTTGRDGQTGFIDPMTKRVTDLGGEIIYNAEAKQLLMDDGAARGVYAKTADGVLQVNAKAVIIATGGYADNDELLAQKGYDTDETAIFGVPGHKGDGIQMALDAGAKSWLENSSLMEYPMNPAIGRDSSSFSRMPNALWVNGEGRRFVDENCGADVPARPALAVRSQEASYCLFTQSLLDGLAANRPAVSDVVSKGVDDGSIFRADSIADLATAAGIDPQTLQATVDQYNGYCAAGSDEQFGKDPSVLVALSEGPYYLSKNSGIYFLTTIGGIDTTENFEVRAEQGGTIPGLYAVGVDGVELYKGLYTIDIPGSCNANNINSGRTAAQHALRNL